MIYRYRKTGKFLICIDQSIVGAFHRLVIDNGRNGLHSLGLNWKRTLRVMKVLISSKIRPVNDRQCISLPIFGHIGLQVHRGVKLFDLKRHEVTKFFAEGVSKEAARAEISASRSASRVEAAPRFLMADAEAAWLKEEFVSGSHATDLVGPDSSDFLRFYPQVEDCLLQLAGIEPWLSVSMTDYVDGLSVDDFEDSWLAAGISSVDIRLTVDYIDDLSRWLHQNAVTDELNLVMTHGDFSLVNVLVVNDVVRVIDWDGISYRSALGDIFNFALAELYYERASGEFMSEACAMFDHYRRALGSRHPELKDDASVDLEFALRLYYLERIKWLAERSASRNLGEVVSKSIEMFRQFDFNLGFSQV